LKKEQVMTNRFFPSTPTVLRTSTRGSVAVRASRRNPKSAPTRAAGARRTRHELGARGTSANRGKHGRALRTLSAALLAAATLSIGASWSSPARAQRGEGYALDEPLDVTPSPDDGFPGAFDTQLARPGAWVSSLPTLTLYYGVSDDFSVGTNLFAFLPLGALNPAGSLFVRHRLGSTSWFRSTVDLVLAGVHGGDTSNYFGAVFVGSNTEFALARQHRLTLNAWYGHLDGTIGDVDMAAEGVLLGGTYSLVLARWAALHATGLYMVSGSGSIGDDNAGSISIELGSQGSVADRVVVRGTASLRAGSWQFDVGALRLGSALLPWLGISFEVGG
jgi:hypothetical protein